MNINNYRYERKFVIQNLKLYEVENLINSHPALFREIYHQRSVRNIYFDTIDLLHYFDNVEGNSSRNKIRVRWYGDLFGKIKESKLELKCKHGLLGHKIHYDLKHFLINKNKELSDQVFNLNELIKNNKKNNNNFFHYFPIISNSYKRKYFLSSDSNFRITLDWDQSFYKVSNGMLCNKMIDINNIILEIKYNYENQKKIDSISQFFPFRLSKNSKYIQGVDFCLS